MAMLVYKAQTCGNKFAVVRHQGDDGLDYSGTPVLIRKRSVTRADFCFRNLSLFLSFFYFLATLLLGLFFKTNGRTSVTV